MGNSYSRTNNIKKNCKFCNYDGNDNDALLKMHSKYNMYNNTFLCIDCFKNVGDNTNLSTFHNQPDNIFKLVNCEWCKVSSCNKEVFKVYSKGKFNNHYMCYLCITSREHRKKSIHNSI